MARSIETARPKGGAPNILAIHIGKSATGGDVLVNRPENDDAPSDNLELAIAAADAGLQQTEAQRQEEYEYVD